MRPPLLPQVFGLGHPVVIGWPRAVISAIRSRLSRGRTRLMQLLGRDALPD